jgi:hypothetical protein
MEAAMLRNAILGLWRVSLLALVLLGMHGWWAIACRDGVHMQRGGAALIFLGILVASLPYWGKSFSDLVQKAIPIRSNHFPVRGSAKSNSERRANAAQGTAREVAAEHYLGVIVILAGTAVNGYGDLPLRWLGLVA